MLALSNPIPLIRQIEGFAFFISSWNSLTLEDGRVVAQKSASGDLDSRLTQTRAISR
jgi:hypothetical protein